MTRGLHLSSEVFASCLDMTTPGTAVSSQFCTGSSCHLPLSFPLSLPPRPCSTLHSLSLSTLYLHSCITAFPHLSPFYPPTPYPSFPPPRAIPPPHPPPLTPPSPHPPLTSFVASLVASKRPVYVHSKTNSEGSAGVLIFLLACLALHTIYFLASNGVQDGV